MNYIKDKTRITVEYAKALKQYIIENQATFFQKDNEADHWRDFSYWSDKKTDRKHLIMSTECLLIDREIKGVHCYVICRILGKETNPKPRVEHLEKVVDIKDLKREYWRNGYFLLPELLTTPTKEEKTV